MLRKMSDIKAYPLRGGMNTVLDRTQLPYGAFSNIENLRPTHPGFKKRGGMSRYNTTPYSTSRIVALYQYRKARVDSKYFLIQAGDGKLVANTGATMPPATTTTLGTAIHTGSTGSNMFPASFCNVDDHLIYSNCLDQHQIFRGESTYVDSFIVKTGTTTLATIPDQGEDYSTEVRNSSSSHVAVLDGLDTAANKEYFFIRTVVPAASFTVTMNAVNGTASTLSVYYWKNDSTWAAVSGLSDGTETGGDTTLAQSGDITFTAPTDEQSRFMYGRTGFWYRFQVSAALDAEVEITSVTYEDTVQDLQNVWDGVPVDPVEVQVEGSTQWDTYGAGAVNLGGLTGGKKIVLIATDPIEGIFADPGSTPNDTGTTISSLKYWDGAAFTTVGTVVDESEGFQQAGWITFPRKAAQPSQFNSSQYYGYLYEIVCSTDIAATCVVAFQTMPYFDINEFGIVGKTCATWKNRAAYSFGQYGEYLYLSATGRPMVLNGSDFGIVQVGDGRPNEIVATRRFQNELMVWQEEKGIEGGCVTIIEGYSPSTWGRLVLTSKIGCVNASSVAVVDGVLTATKTEEKLKTIAFWISRYGICATDGRVVSIISDDIGNYFDPSESTCIRRGYEHAHWLAHDSADNVLRVGLVTGSSIFPNTFLVFDLVDKTWSFDTYHTNASRIGCFAEIEAHSDGTVKTPVVQYTGGFDDGTVYRVNTGNDDTNAAGTTLAIESDVQMEMNGEGRVLFLDEAVVNMAAQAAGDLTLYLYEGGTAKGSKALSMVKEAAANTHRRHRFYLDITHQNISVRFYHGTAGQDVELFDLGLAVSIWEGV